MQKLPITWKIRGHAFQGAMAVTNKLIPDHHNDVLSDHHHILYGQVMRGTRYIINENLFGSERAPVPARGLDQIAKKYR